MRWRIGYLLVWLTATCLAIALSWIGVRSVLQASVFSTPVVVSVTAAPAPSAASASPVVSAQAPVHASVHATATPAASHASASASPPGSASPSASATAATDIHDYSTAGGTAVLEVTATSVRFISAMANAGYTAEESYGTDWLRVDFLTGNGAHGWSVVASWYLHAPTIQLAQF